MADWVTISALATAGGTLVLAAATFSSVRSANRSARVAERSLLAAQRPLLMPSRVDDTPQKVNFADGRWVLAPGGGGMAEVTADAVYLALSLRNVGTGIAVLHGWHFDPDRVLSSDRDQPAPLEQFHRLSRDLYVAPGDVGFWQGAFRDPRAAEFGAAADAIRTRTDITIEVLYGDQEGGQRVIGRFTMAPMENGGWRASAGRHWNLDRPDPR